MTYLEAAITVLKSAREPMTSGEITEAAIRKGLISPRGKTPEATMSAELYQRLKDAPRGDLRREFEAGRTRAVRNSVRWTLRARS